MDFSNPSGPFVFETNDELDISDDYIDNDLSEFVQLLIGYDMDIPRTSNSQTLPRTDADSLVETYLINDIPDIVRSFEYLTNVGSDPLVERNIQEQRQRLAEFINQSPFLNEVYRDEIEASLNEPSPKRPVPDDVFKALPIVKIDQKLIDLNESCTICTEKYSLNEDVLLLSCNHAYHKDCIQKWFQEQNMCPICRKKVSEDSDQPGSNSNEYVMLDLNYSGLPHSNSNEFDMFDMNDSGFPDSNSNEFEMFDMNDSVLLESNSYENDMLYDLNEESGVPDLGYEILSAAVYNCLFDVVNTSLPNRDYEM